MSCYKLIEGFPLTSIVGDGAGVGKGRTVAGVRLLFANALIYS